MSSIKSVNKRGQSVVDALDAARYRVLQSNVEFVAVQWRTGNNSTQTVWARGPEELDLVVELIRNSRGVA